MPAVWQALGNCVPATWGIQGFIAINSNGATLAQAGGPYRMLWLCATVYLIAAWAVNARRRR
jgi:ABC-2 type transport system permease protein